MCYSEGGRCKEQGMAGFTTQFSTQSLQSYVRGAWVKSMDSFRLTASCENNDDDLTSLGSPTWQKKTAASRRRYANTLQKTFTFARSVRLSLYALWEKQMKGEKERRSRQRGRAGKGEKKHFRLSDVNWFVVWFEGMRYALYVCIQMRLAALTEPDNPVHHLQCIPQRISIDNKTTKTRESVFWPRQWISLVSLRPHRWEKFSAKREGIWSPNLSL